MSKEPLILTDPFTKEENPELFETYIDWEEEERILEEEKKQERRDKRKSLFKGRKNKV